MTTPTTQRDRPPKNLTIHRNILLMIDVLIAGGKAHGARNVSEYFEIVACKDLDMPVPPRPNDVARKSKARRAGNL